MTPRQSVMFEVAQSYFNSVPTDMRSEMERMYQAFKNRLLYELSTVTYVDGTMCRGTVVERPIEPQDAIS